MSLLYPHKKAIVWVTKKPWGSLAHKSITFKELENKIDSYGNAFVNWGIKKGDRSLVFIRPSTDFVAVIFALFKIGAIPVLMDPGISKLFSLIKKVQAKVLIGTPLIHILRFLRPIPGISIFINTKWSIFPKAHSLKFLPPPSFGRQAVSMEKDETAAIFFTSGATGTPKGVVYTHSILLTQINLLRDMFDLKKNDLDVAAFPLFSLFTLSMGITSVIPPVNFSRPAKSDPAPLVKLINDLEGTFLTGSPAIWKKVAHYCHQNNMILHSVKRLALFGTAVDVELHRLLRPLLPKGTTYTPYGATECLPVSNISGKEILKNTASLTKKGKGTCVGFPPEGINIKIIHPVDGPIDDFSLIQELRPYQVGEIIVAGPIVTESYYGEKEQTSLAKIMDGDTIWHRMGDMGHMDVQGRLWYCGRKTYLVSFEKKILYTSCEAIFNSHPAVNRSALISLNQRPALVIEKNKTKIPQKTLNREILSMAQSFHHTKDIHEIHYGRLPVDIRHNIKIDRLKLQESIQRGLS